MSAVTDAAPARSRGRDPIRWPVPRAAHRAVLIVHVISTVGWLGLDVALAVLVVVPMVDPGWTAACYQVLPLLFWPIVVASVLGLVSGVTLGLTSRWGLVRHWWVAIKLTMNVVLIVLVLLLLGPALDQAGAFGRALATGAPALGDVPRLYMPPLVSGTLLIVATVLSVWKPKARLSRRA